MNLYAEKIELIKVVLETEKESVIKNLKQLLIDDLNDYQHELTSPQKSELDMRIQRMENGDTKFYSWEEVEQKMRNVL